MSTGPSPTPTSSPSPSPSPTPSNYLYAANTQVSGAIYAYQVHESTGALTELASSPISAGNNPYGVAATPNGKYLYVTNNGSISAYSTASDGSLTELSGSPYADSNANQSWATVDPSGKFLLFTNYANDSVSVYAIASNGSISQVASSPYNVNISPGGPTQIVFHPNGTWVYFFCAGAADGVNEASFNTTTGALTGSGAWGVSQSIQPTAGSLAMDPSGNYVYMLTEASVTTNGIFAYSVSSSNGNLTFSGGPYGSTSVNYENMLIDPAGKYVFTTSTSNNNGGTNEMQIFTVSGGTLTQIGSSPMTVGTSGNGFPVVDPTSTFLYLPIIGATDLLGYGIATSGALTALGSSPFGAGTTLGPPVIVTVQP